MIKLAKLRQGIVHPLQHFMHSTGVLPSLDKWRADYPAIVLMYHSVAAADHAAWIDPRNHLAPSAFEEQMSFLARHRHVISLSQLVRLIQHGESCPAGTVVITFDDGYLDNLTEAAPILQKYNLTATLFLPTGYIDRGETQWIDRLFSIFQFRTIDSVCIGTAIHRRFDLRAKAEFMSAYNSIASDLLEATYQQRTEILSRLREQLKPSSSPPSLTMTWTDVRALLRRYPNIEIGAHTVNHLDMTKCESTQAKLEVDECKTRIECETNLSPQHFSYPYGRSNAQLHALVAKCGFDSACNSSGVPEINSVVDTFAIPRVEAPPSSYRFGYLTSSANTGLLYRMGR